MVVAAHAVSSYGFWYQEGRMDGDSSHNLYILGGLVFVGIAVVVYVIVRMARKRPPPDLPV